MEKWFSHHFVIQDFYIPQKSTAKFVEDILQKYQITPLWLCPILPTKTAQFFSPHFNQKEEVDLLFDVGIYGFPQSKMNGEEITRHLEQLTESFKGRKMLYGDSYYFEEEFWKIYSKELYVNLRQKYSAEGTWLNITEKVLNKF
jgi:hypothetical protein